MTCPKCGRMASEATWIAAGSPFMIERCTDPCHDLADTLVAGYERRKRCTCPLVTDWECEPQCDCYSAHKGRDYCDTCGHPEQCHAAPPRAKETTDG